jgi:hypothetical protein
MVDPTPFLRGLSPVQGKAVVARFDGGRLSSEGGNRVDWIFGLALLRHVVALEKSTTERLKAAPRSITRKGKSFDSFQCSAS